PPTGEADRLPRPVPAAHLGAIAPPSPAVPRSGETTGAHEPAAAAAQIARPVRPHPVPSPEESEAPRSAASGSATAPVAHSLSPRRAEAAAPLQRTPRRVRLGAQPAGGPRLPASAGGSVELASNVERAGRDALGRSALPPGHGASAAATRSASGSDWTRWLA